MDNDSGRTDAAEPVLTPDEILERTLRRKYEELSKAADEDEAKDPTLKLLNSELTKDDLASTGGQELNTKRELANEYYEQWQLQLKKMGKSDADMDTPESSTDEE